MAATAALKIVRTGLSSYETSCVIPSIAKFKRNRTFTFPVSHLTFPTNEAALKVPIRIAQKTGGSCQRASLHRVFKTKAGVTHPKVDS